MLKANGLRSRVRRLRRDGRKSRATLSLTIQQVTANVSLRLFAESRLKPFMKGLILAQNERWRRG